MGLSFKAVPDTPCSICGELFHIKPSHKAKITNLSCSLDCAKVHMKRRMSGARNHQHGLTGSLNSTWKGGRRLSFYGYILVDEGGGYQFEHRSVYPCDCEVIHHKNGIKVDNRLSNLECMSLADHCILHSTLDAEFRLRDKEGKFTEDNRSAIKQEVVQSLLSYDLAYPETLLAVLPKVWHKLIVNCRELLLNGNFKIKRSDKKNLYNVTQVKMDELIEHLQYCEHKGDLLGMYSTYMNLALKLYITK